MRSGVEQEPGRGQPRLVPQPDGYAEYVDPGAPPPGNRPTGPGQHRSSARRASGPTPIRSIPTGSFRIKGVQTPRRGQRAIRSTITWLLILPVVTMIGLYVYSAYGTIKPAQAKQDSATVNADIGVPFSTMVQTLEVEEAQSFAYQASFHHTSPLTSYYQKTDAAVAVFLAGDTKAAGAESPQTRAEDPNLRTALASLATIRARAQTAAGEGPNGGLATFKQYLGIQEEITKFSTGLANPNASIAENEESQVIIEDGTGTEDLVDVGTLLGGVVAGGGVMTPAEYEEFLSLYYEQQVNFKQASNPLYWQVSPDPYNKSSLGPGVMSSPQVQAMLNLEKSVLKAGSLTHPVQLGLNPAKLVATIDGAILPPNAPLIQAEVISARAITANDNHQGNLILWRLAIIGGVGLLVVILSTFLLLRFGARISRELRGLRNAAQTLSGERLPSVVRRLRAGDDVDVVAEAPPLELRTRTREVTDTADAFSAVQHTAIQAAVEQATLRKGVANVFRSLARRNQSLVQRQLRMLDEMERGTQDPDALAQLFKLDHLTTRMRRQAEGLIILSGSAPGRRWRQPVPVVEVLRGAISEIEDYVRVDLASESPDFLTGAAVADVTHLLAELIENAVVYSPPATRVQVRGGRVANGYVIEVEDRGLGIPPAARDDLNERLATPPDFDLTDSDQLGLFVVSRLAIRNQIKVSLRESGFGGTTAIVLLPGALVVTEEEARVLAAQGAPRSALGAGSRPTDVEGSSTLSGRRAPRLEQSMGVADDSQGMRMGDTYGTGSFSSGPVGNGSYGGASNGGSSYGGGAAYGTGPSSSPGRGQSFGGGSPFGGAEPFGGGESLPTRGSGSFGGAGSLPSRGGSFGGESLPTRGSGSFGGGESLPTRSGSSFGGGPSTGDSFGGSPFGGQPASGDSFGSATGGGSVFGGGSLPSRAGSRGAFGSPAPFQDAPSPVGGRGAFGSPAPFQDAPAPAAPSPFNAAGDGGGQMEGVGTSGLPKRQKMASLAPQLRENRPEAPKGTLSGRSPEQARALLSNIQRGLRTGRDSDTGDGSGNGPGPGSDAGDA